MNVKTEHNLHESEICYNIPQSMIEALPTRYGTIIFAAYGCVLAERLMPSGMYVYMAVNIKTGAPEALSRRKYRLTQSGHAEMVARIYKSSICGDSIHTTDKKPDDKKSNDSLINTTHHIFNKILPLHGYNIRDKQIELALHMLDVIRQKGISLAESEVGTGKTLAYIIAASLVKRGRLNDGWLRGHYTRQSWAESAHMPVIISTSSIALQKAIETDYIPDISRILIENNIIKTPLTSVIRKGKEHYICEKRLQSYHKAADDFTKNRLEPFIEFTAPFDLTGVDSLSPYMKRRICVMEKCPETCKYKDKCRYTDYMKMANDHRIDFQITNHNYFLADTLHRASGRKPLLPNYQLIIIDEAHKLLGAARQMYGLELTNKEIPALAQEVHAITAGKSNGGINVHRLAKKMEEQSRNLFWQLNDNIPTDADDEQERFSAVMDGEVGRYLQKLGNITSELAEAVAGSRISKLHTERQSKVIWKLTSMSERVSSMRKQSKLIHWFEKRIEGETKTDALCGIPKDLDARLYIDLWSKGIPIILTSGTLSASGDFTRVKETLGLNYKSANKLFSVSMPSPFDFKKNQLIYISKNVPFPDNKDKRYIAAVADEVELLVKASHGHAAVLFTSYNAMGQVHAILRDRRLPYPLFRLERGGIHAIERFKQSGNGILMASGALWEGIDIPGDILSMLIIVRLPFAVPDPISDYEREQCGSMEVFRQRVIIPDKQIKVKQGAGRLLRCETDAGVVAIIDIRASESGAYHITTLKALPADCRITYDPQVVQDFYVDIKSDAFFI